MPWPREWPKAFAVAGVIDDGASQGVGLVAGHAGAYGVDGVELGVQHGVVDLVQLFICGTDNYGAGDVTAVAVDPGAHVDDHGFAGLDGFIGGAVVGQGAVWSRKRRWYRS